MARIKIGLPCGLTDGNYHTLRVGDIIRNICSGIKAEINSYGKPVNNITGADIKNYKTSEWVLDTAWDADPENLKKKLDADKKAEWYEKKKEQKKAASEAANEAEPEKTPAPAIAENEPASTEPVEEAGESVQTSDAQPEESEPIPDWLNLDADTYRKAKDAVRFLRSVGFDVVAEKRVCYTVTL